MRAIEEIDFGQVARRFDLELILLFGSRVSGPVHQASDVDLAVLTAEKTAGEIDVFDMAGAFMELLETDRVDVVLLNDAGYFLAYEITQSCRVLYESRPNRFVDYAQRALQRYEAHKPLENLRQEILYEQVLGQPGSGS